MKSHDDATSAFVPIADFGTPLGPGKETVSGHYTREFTKATISRDCGSWRGTSTMKLDDDDVSGSQYQVYILRGASCRI